MDPLGHAVAEPKPRPGRALKVVEQDGRRIASISYDAALDDEPELLDAVTAAAGLTLRSDRLQVELRAEVEFLDTVTNTVPSLLAIVGTTSSRRPCGASRKGAPLSTPPSSPSSSAEAVGTTRSRSCTPREREVLELMAEGRSNQAIADRLFVTPRAVEKHVTSIFLKFDLPATTEDHRRVLAVLAFLRA